MVEIAFLEIRERDVFQVPQRKLGLSGSNAGKKNNRGA
jgi:hypothetical protein